MPTRDWRRAWMTRMCVSKDHLIADRARAELARLELHKFRRMRESVERGEGFAAAKGQVAVLEGKMALLKRIIDEEE